MKNFNVKMKRAFTLLSSSLYFRWASLVVIAAGVAYIGANIMSNYMSPTIAAVTAALLVQGTFHESVKESVIQFAGISLAVCLGLIVNKGIGFSPLTLILSVGVGLMVGFLMKMKIENAVTMVIPIILVIGGNSFNVHSIEDRVLGVLFGATVAIVASYLTRSGKPTDRMAKVLSDCSHETADIMKTIAEDLQEHKVDREKTKYWIESLTTLVGETSEVKNIALKSIEQSKYSPFLSKAEVEKVIRQADINIIIASTVLNIAKELDVSLDILEEKHEVLLPDGVAKDLRNYMSLSADLVSSQAPGKYSVRAAAPVKLEDEDIAAIDGIQKTVVSAVMDLEDTQPLLLSSSILQDSRTIKDTLLKVAEEK